MGFEDPTHRAAIRPWPSKVEWRAYSPQRLLANLETRSPECGEERPCAGTPTGDGRRAGRPLTQDEVVHHIDGDSENNDPANLQLFATNAEHRATNFNRAARIGHRRAGEGFARKQIANMPIACLRQHRMSGGSLETATITEMDTNQPLRWLAHHSANRRPDDPLARPCQNLKGLSPVE